MYKLSFYVLENHLASVKEAIFSAGGGMYGEFRNCAWEAKGVGQYQGSNDTLNCNPEYKVEILCQPVYLHKAIEALKLSHPCPNPIFYFMKVETDL